MFPRAEFQTARLRLRPVGPRDAGPVIASLNDIAVSGWLTIVPHPYSQADFDAFQQEYAMPGATYAIEDKDGFVGIMGVEGRSLGYWIAPKAHGQGYGTEAARAALAEHFAASPDDVTSGYFEGNDRSAKVLKNLGFVETGRGVRFCRALNMDRPHVAMSLTHDVFVANLPELARTARLRLRALLALDVPALNDIVSQEGVTRQLGPAWPWPADPAFTLTRSGAYRGPGFVWGITCDSRLIGTVAVTDGTLGYMLHPDHQGQGLASEAVERALSHAFDVHGLVAVKADVWADNAASLGLLTRMGFVVTGENRGRNNLRPENSPGFDLILTRAVWEARSLIRSRRLTMRPMSRSDAHLFHDLVTRPEVAHFLFMFHPDWTLSEAETLIKDWAWAGRLRFRLALIHQGAWIGWIGVSDLAEPEIFYALRPEFAGQGLAREAVQAFTRFVFQTFDPPALTAGVFTDNPASAKVLTACGFELIREEMHASRGRLAPAPCWVYRLANPKQADPS